MTQPAVHPVDPAFADSARITREDYRRDYEASVRDPEQFWARIGQRLDWMTPPTVI